MNDQYYLQLLFLSASKPSIATCHLLQQWVHRLEKIYVQALTWSHVTTIMPAQIEGNMELEAKKDFASVACRNGLQHQHKWVWHKNKFFTSSKTKPIWKLADDLTLEVKLEDQNTYFAQKTIIYNISKNTQPKKILSMYKGQWTSVGYHRLIAQSGPGWKIVCYSFGWEIINESTFITEPTCVSFYRGTSADDMNSCSKLYHLLLGWSTL